jgi:hypothetical protein
MASFVEMKMNPYEAREILSTDTFMPSTARRNRFANIACVLTSSIAMPCVAVWTIQIVNSLVISNMGFWMIILMFFCLLVAVPIGLLALVVGRAIDQHNVPFRRTVLSLILVLGFPVTYKIIALLAVLRIDNFWLDYGTLVATSSLIPFLLGLLVYSVGTGQLNSQTIDEQSVGPKARSNALENG